MATSSPRTIDPFSAGVGWAVKLDKGEFVGRDALLRRKESPARSRIGLRLEGKRIARQGAIVLAGDREAGLVTSGTFSPTLQQSIAMALVSPDATAIGTAALGRRPRPPRARPRRQAALLQAARVTRPIARISERGRHRMDPQSLRYTPTHEWVSLQDDVATVGISKFAVDQLTDLILIELPAVGTRLAAGKSFGEVESVKASATCMHPVAGEVIEVNDQVAENVQLLADDPYGAGLADQGPGRRPVGHRAAHGSCGLREEGGRRSH